MCGRYTNTQRRSDEIEAKLAATLGVQTPASGRGFERFNIAPTQQVLAVVDDRDGRRVEELRWGLVPHWAPQLKTRFAMINARAETLEEKPAYRGLVRHASRRCLILADGWYEWQRPEDPASAEAAAALRARARRSVLLCRPLDALEGARRRGRSELHDRDLRRDRAGPPDPRPHAGRLGRRGALAGLARRLARRPGCARAARSRCPPPSLSCGPRTRSSTPPCTRAPTASRYRPRLSRERPRQMAFSG